jgi:photosystem II stability/assembly factor-like uncharacterized protein
MKVCKEEEEMKYRKTGAAIAVAVILLVAGVSLGQVAGPDVMRKGVAFVRQPSGPHYDSPEAETSFCHLRRATNANWVTIVPIQWQVDTGGSAIYFRPDSSPSDSELRSIIRFAHDSAISVFLKPEIRCSSGVWIGRHKPRSAAWFNYYRVFIMHYARLAQEEGCQMFSVGSELDSAADDAWERVQWVNIINWVKGEYLGPVTYAADWRTYRSIGFWDSLDYVGINAYFPLYDQVEPDPLPDSMTYFSWVWKNRWIPEIVSFLDSTQSYGERKPVVFTEIGYRSITDCARYPWDYSVEGTYNEREQRDCYMAGLHSLLGKPWFAGWYWREWTTDSSQGGSGDLSYSPKDKPAQEVLRRWSASIGSHRGADFPTIARDQYGWERTHWALESLAQTKANWVGINARWLMDTIGAYYDTIAPDSLCSPSDASIRTAVRWARGLGLNVCLSAYLACRSNDWQNTHEPSGSVDWFRDESVFVSHYARIAEEESCEMYTVGLEMNNTTDDAADVARWHDMVIPGARKEYSGPLVYGANRYFLVPDMPPITPDTVLLEFWDALDFAGIDAYFKLFPPGQYPGFRDTGDLQTPNVLSLRTGLLGWETKWLPRLDSLYRVIERPILFTEIGWRSIDSTAFHEAYDFQYGWYDLASGTTNDLYSVSFPVDTLTGYAVGESGTILKTTNSGASWSGQSSGTTRILKSVHFPVRDTGYVVGDSGTVLKTTTGGSTWATCNSGTSLGLHSVHFVSADTGYAVGADGIILKTVNGWTSWENQAVDGQYISYHAVHFPQNSATGYIVGDGGMIMKTTNGGGNWTRRYGVRPWGDTVRTTLRSVSFERDTGQPAFVGCAVGDSATLLLVVAPDTGQPWLADSFINSDADFQSVCIARADSARYVVGEGGWFLRAGDGWPLRGSPQHSPKWDTTMRGVDFPMGDQVGFAVGDYGTIARSATGGRMIVDFNEQANCYEATFKSFWDNWLHPNPLPWFYGFHLWAWATDPEPMVVMHEGRIGDYTPQQKPAGQVLRQWYDWPPPQLQGQQWMVHHYPTGSLDVVVPPTGKVDEPLALFKLESHSWERDGAPADSARLLQEYYGLGDALIAVDSTGWFPFTSDTSWRFLSGQGKYRFYVQYLDAPDKVSPPYPDFEDTVVVFDTVPATGSIVINHGARFAPSATCTLRLAAFDSASGVGWMRFMNDPKGNLVRNGAFAQTDGSWSFYGSGSGYDSSLQMAVLAVSGPQECRARQFVPAESISAHFGDSCVLEANILAHMHGGTASGNASFWYWRTRTNPNLHDTMWTSIATASYSGDVISKTGRDNLSARFLLAPPTSQQGWVWRGGMVKVKAQGVSGGTGKVWTDNVALHPFQAQSGCAWWGTYDSLAAWGMGSAAGQHVIRALYLDSAGTESAVALADTVILDPTAPAVHISVLQSGQYVSDTVEITGWAYDSVEVSGDTWFASYRLQYKNAVSGDWQGIDPDSVSYTPVYSVPVSGVPRHLGYWSTDSLADGNYYLMLTATDSVGHTSSCTTWVVINSDTTDDDFRAGPPGGGSGMGEGSVYIGSTTGQVLHLSEDLDSLDCFSVTDSGTQAYVTAILEVGDDSLLILDARNKRIHKLHRNGRNSRRLVSNLSIPAGVERDDNGNFWLVDKGIHKIGKFRSNGTLVFTRGGLGADSLHFNSPEAIAVKGSLVYVADTKNNRIAVWDTSGSFIAAIKGNFENPTAVMVTDSGAIYLTDGTDGKLKGINPRGGSFLTIAEANGSQFQGLVLSENGHSLFTLAPQPNTVHKLRIRSDDSVPGGQQSQANLNLPKLLTLNQPFPNPARTRLNIHYALPRQIRVTLKLYDIAGKLVTTFANGDQKPGYYNLTWNREDTKGRTCACGVYFCTLTAEGQRFSRKVVLTE